MRISDWSSDVCSSDLIAEHPVERRVLVEIAAAIDDAVADAVLQWNAPLPARIMRHDARIGHRRMDVGGLERDRTVARQPVGPVVEPGVERAFHQQRAKPRAIDEQIALDPPVAVEDKCRNIAALPIALDARDLALAPRSE